VEVPGGYATSVAAADEAVNDALRGHARVVNKNLALPALGRSHFTVLTAIARLANTGVDVTVAAAATGVWIVDGVEAGRRETVSVQRHGACKALAGP